MNKINYLKEILEMLKKVIGENNKFSLHEPLLTNIDKDHLIKCIDSGYVSSVGKFVDKFENKIKKITNSKNAIALVNGTVALEIALRLTGVKYGDEVFVPALTFVGTANAILHANATPHFIDSDIEHLGISYEKLDDHISKNCIFKGNKLFNKLTGKTISAIIPVHVFGLASNMEKLKAIASKYNLQLVEDATEALGSYYKNKSLGTFGRAGVFSFNGNKIITTGGGGLIVTDDDKLADKIRHVTRTSKIPHEWKFYHDEKGWNFRMPNLNASLGCAQVKQFKHILKKKRNLAKLYKKATLGLKNFSFISELEETTSNYWLNTIRLNNSDESLLEYLLVELNNKGYNCRPAWTLLNELPMFLNCPRSNLDNAKQLSNSLINLPSSSMLI